MTGPIAPRLPDTMLSGPSRSAVGRPDLLGGRILAIGKRLGLLYSRAGKGPQWLRAMFRRLAFPDQRRPQALCTSLDLAQDATLSVLTERRLAFHSRLLKPAAQEFIGWGRRWSGLRAVELARRHGGRFILVEDGFLRSVDRHAPALSMVLDRRGIYYDATSASDFEELVRAAQPACACDRAARIIALWRDHRLSKYNALPDYAGPLPEKFVLVADQTAGDASIAFGMAGPESFERMLNAALRENPEAVVIVKSHPDGATRKSCFDPRVLQQNPRVQVISTPCHPARLLEHAQAVYAVTSQLGFEALLWGKRVRTFGMPFYAGWGLTEDDLPSPERRCPIALEQLVHAALVDYPGYVDPETGQRCEVERAIAHVGLQRRMRQALPARIGAYGFSRWKRPFIRAFLQGAEVRFLRRNGRGQGLENGAGMAVWGSTEPPPATDGATILRIEDGFLRSSGLGADLVRPLSLVVDDIGIHYDATGPSRLEQILATQTPGPDDRARARRLRARICALDVTKYNLGSDSWFRPRTADRVLLVVGQVESDASLRFGSPEVRSNLELLRRVRTENPDAFVVFKPHPDVAAGLRPGGDQEALVRLHADVIVTGPVSIGQLLSQVDEVHTMTSLLGFEALIRGVKTVCHGLPFFAGWGLTEDRLSCPRRNRRLTLDDIVHAALITYPRYFDHRRNCFVEVETVVDRLGASAAAGPRPRSWQRRLLRVVALARLQLRGPAE